MSHVWYVSYGSNLSAERLACYLDGGRPSGGTRHHPGARDASPPLRDRPVDLPGTTYFAGESTQWGGGVAFYDHDSPGFTAGRGYLLTAGQFADVAAQEMHRVPRADDPIEEIVLSPLPDGRHTAGPGRYETLIEVDRHDGVPLLLFTAPHGSHSIARTPPSSRYLATLASGLRESRGWADDRIDDYLLSLQPAA